MKHSLLLTTLLAGTIVMAPHHANAVKLTTYPGGPSIVTMHDADRTMVHGFYSATSRFSFGPTYMYDRNAHFNAASLQANFLLKRINRPSSQANAYLSLEGGKAWDSSNTENFAAASGILDWEDRRFFVSYEPRVEYAGDFGRAYSSASRVGVAPYVAEAGKLHTWLMVQLDHKPGTDDDTWRVTPLVRFFKGDHLGEFGVSTKGDVLFNYAKNF